jgi:hypothetical protein
MSPTDAATPSTSPYYVDNLPTLCQDLLKHLQGPFEKVIKPSLSNRTHGNVCLNCFSFFTRDSSDFKLHPDHRTVKINTFIKDNSITDIDSLSKAVSAILIEENNQWIKPSLGRQECLFQTQLLLNVKVSHDLMVSSPKNRSLNEI